jgi:hypothetical protein
VIDRVAQSVVHFSIAYSLVFLLFFFKIPAEEQTALLLANEQTSNNMSSPSEPATSSEPPATHTADTQSQGDLAVVPKDKVGLRLLLSNGKKADFLFQPTDTVAAVKQSVFEQWPKGTF